MSGSGKQSGLGPRYSTLWAACGRLAKEGFLGGAFEIKEDNSLVTETDRGIEELLTRELESGEGRDRVIGEETVARKGEDYLQKALGGSLWIVDPIDGTAPFANGFPQWGISAARGEGGEITDGLIYFPAWGPGEGNIFWNEGPEVWSAYLDPDSENLERISRMKSPVRPWNAGRMVSLSQKRARRGNTDLPNPLQSNGACIYSLWGLMTGRYGAYLGDFKVWDAAAGWALASRLGVKGLFLDGEGGDIRPFNSSLGEDSPYHLSHSGGWHVRGPVAFYSDPAAETALRSLLKRELSADPA